MQPEDAEARVLTKEAPPGGFDPGRDRAK